MSRFFLNVAPPRATCPRRAIGWVLVLALLLLPGIVGCQMPPSNSAALDDLNKRVTKLADEAATKREFAATDDAYVKAHNDLMARFGQLDGQVTHLAAKVDQDISSRVDKLETGLKDTNQRLAAGENSAAIRNSLVDWRFGNLEESGRHSTYEHTTLKPDAPPTLPSTPRPASPSRGVIQIENNMTTWQYVEVDGIPTGIARGLVTVFRCHRDG